MKSLERRKNPNFRIWPDLVHDLDQETKSVYTVLKTLHTKSDRGGKILISPEPDQAGPSGRQVNFCDKRPYFFDKRSTGGEANKKGDSSLSRKLIPMDTSSLFQERSEMQKGWPNYL